MKTFLLTLLTLTVAFACGRHHNQDTNPHQDSPHHIIYNGVEATEGFAPYIVRMYLKHVNGSSADCVGSIIGDSWIVTAARCLRHKSYAVIYYGSNNRRSNIKHKVPKENFILHERSGDRPNYSHNIGLIRTPWPIEFSDKIAKIALPQFGDRYERIERRKFPGPMVCGWGPTMYTHRPQRLQCAKVPIISNEECDRQMHFKARQITNDEVFCSGLQRGESTCRGDSGAPFIDNNALVGIASFGGCGRFSGYVRVSHFLDWIYDRTGTPL
ncbi:uncharacterized protein Dwil_GK27827 [Drosophila willistoni]|uniref:Peptidase S1 domain-containing protein n=1 Tax=Drosophila willistoni TaxID=7260 RepID=A0A0Q9WPZ5_DROWI|nr:uncharacterized protein Dwil_GK27827 [Drosophila willistoni]